MTSSRRRQPASFIILIAAVYLAAFLLHDLTHDPAPVFADYPVGPHGFFADQNGGGSPDGNSRVHPNQESHHCPFCNGFTGGVTVTMLPPPAENNSKPPRPPSRSHSGESLCSSFARAPPAA